jgi:hypothetical protein
MKNAIDWIKSNPIVAAAALVSALGIVVIGYFYFVSAPAFSAEKTDLLKKEKQKLDALIGIDVPLPNEDPNAPPDIYSIVVNQTVINNVSEIYRKIQTQYEEILVNSKNKNNEEHIQFLLGRGEIWPDKNPQTNFALYVQAASDYKAHFKAVFDKDSSTNNWNLPHMVASSPPTQAELEMLLAQSAFDYISSVGAQSASDLSQSQANQLYAEQRMVLMNALNNRARSIHIYAQLPPEEDRFAPVEPESGEGATPRPGLGVPFGSGGGATTQGSSSLPTEYPFYIEPWADSDQPPTPDQLWEGQNHLWILRDIMSTITRFNRVGQNDVEAIAPDGTPRKEPASVVNSPIKRLGKLHTLSGYVGLHNTGAALGGEDDAEFASSSFTSGSSDFGNSSPGDVFPGDTAEIVPSIYPSPPLELAPKDPTIDAPEHFGITPTGRVSNSVFDVRHTQLIIDIEAARLPAFIEALHDTNFMTVVKAKITDLDEYELLREGYVYGHSDVVQAELIVESLWFRNWTKELMPKIVQEKLLIILPEVNTFEDPLDEPL